MGTQRDAQKACAPMADSGIRWDLLIGAFMIPSVRKLQLRIAKAFREGRRSRVKALQRILTRSCSTSSPNTRLISRRTSAPVLSGGLWLLEIES